MRAAAPAVAAAVKDIGGLIVHQRDAGDRKALHDADALIDALRRRGWALVPLPGMWDE